MGTELGGGVNTTREERRALLRENSKQPKYLVPVEGWQYSSHIPDGLIEVWRSREFLVQIFREGEGIVRASVNRTTIDASSGRWHDSISWDELQRIKREIGRGHMDAVEVYPNDSDVVNVANMRHLWIFADPLPYKWSKNAT
ncbi:DUF7694 domain-containing protein [Cupriavidus basilensis]|uniref:DUF7694 domain-containing protein n=1 Tax=Cupriavidus basilensis TaxID=68895 RepID=UPI0018CF8945|nr:hypothetical protein [Cupriavidus basilensis]